MLQNSLTQTLTNVEELLEEQRAEAFFQEAWEPQAAAAEKWQLQLQQQLQAESMAQSTACKVEQATCH